MEMKCENKEGTEQVTIGDYHQLFNIYEMFPKCPQIVESPTHHICCSGSKHHLWPIDNLPNFLATRHARWAPPDEHSCSLDNPRNVSGW